MRQEFAAEGDDTSAGGGIRPGDLVRHANALLHDGAIAKEYEALTRAQHTVQRALGARTKQHGQIAASCRGLRRFTELRDGADAKRGVSDVRHIIPAAASHRFGVGLAPGGGCSSRIPRLTGVVDVLNQLSPPRLERGMPSIGREL